MTGFPERFGRLLAFLTWRTGWLLLALMPTARAVPKKHDVYSARFVSALNRCRAHPTMFRVTVAFLFALFSWPLRMMGTSKRRFPWLPTDSRRLSGHRGGALSILTSTRELFDALIHFVTVTDRTLDSQAEVWKSVVAYHSIIQARLDGFRTTASLQEFQHSAIQLGDTLNTMSQTLPRVLGQGLRSIQVLPPEGTLRRSAHPGTSVLSFWAALLPARIANEDLGDYFEDIARRSEAGQRSLVWVRVMAAMFWTAVNAAGYLLKRVGRRRGI